jgi:hypothetical protein
MFSLNPEVPAFVPKTQAQDQAQSQKATTYAGDAQRKRTGGQRARRQQMRLWAQQCAQWECAQWYPYAGYPVQQEEAEVSAGLVVVRLLGEGRR